MTNQELIADLTRRTQENLEEAKQLLSLDETTLNWKANPESWSILECMEHLNRYGDFYIPETKKRMASATKTTSSNAFKSGWLGNYFAKSMLPKEKLNTMKTFKNMNPKGGDLDRSHLEKFIAQQKEWLKILAEAETIHLSKTKTSITISNLIKLRLGDTLRVVIYHNDRHIVQAKKVLVEMRA
ncbi:MAG: DinB family protein [Saprospiraceae bacterium]